MFKDGAKIEADYPIGEYVSTMFGDLRCEEKGKCTIKDVKNKIECTIEYGKIKKKASDYFDSVMYIDGHPKHKIYGTYCGHIEADNKRYWDGRDIQPFPMKMEEDKKILLPSDWQTRTDLILLKENRMDDAQD